MKFLDWLISFIDGITLRISAEQLNERSKKTQLLVGGYDSGPARFVRDSFASIDAKATAVLQHVSIMIAVSGILYTQATGKFFGFLFALEMLIYVVLAVFCLRLLMTKYVPGATSEIDDTLAKDAVFDAVAKLTYFLSLVLVVTVVLELVVK